MARTHRTHLPTDEYSTRAHTRRKLREQEARRSKSHKQCRRADKVALRGFTSR